MKEVLIVYNPLRHEYNLDYILNIDEYIKKGRKTTLKYQARPADRSLSSHLDIAPTIQKIAGLDIFTETTYNFSEVTLK